MPTILDVAKMAGVSSATVSHVINNSRFVAPDTRNKVVDAISKLGYRRDGIARSLRRSQTGTIGLMISDITNPFFPDVVRGVEDTVYSHDQNHNLILCNTEESSDKERLYLDVLLEKRIDGIVMAPAGGNRDYLSALLADGVPIVFVDRRLEGLAVDAVVVDNDAAARRIVSHLVSLGHRRIAIVMAELRSSAIMERMDGYRAALDAAGLPFNPDYVFTSASSIEEACTAGLQLLDTHPRPTAVFATNNFMTIGIMQALTQRGLQCPADLAVVGFDDFPWASAFRPRLTTVAQPGYDLGRIATELLFQRVTKQLTGPPIIRVLHTTLHLRESSGGVVSRDTPAT